MAANLVAARGNRTTATILSTIETEIYMDIHVPDPVKRKVRQIVLDQMNGYKDLVIDIVKSDTALLNEHWVSQIDEIHKAIKELK
jgi:hypothetical protein